MDHPVQVDVTGEGTVRLVLTGSVILVRHDEVLTTLERALKTEPATRVLVDLAEVTSLDSSGVALLLLVRRHTRRAGLEFRLHGARPAVHRHLHMAGLTTLLGLQPPQDPARANADGAGARSAVVADVLDERFEIDDIRAIRERLAAYATSIGLSWDAQYKLLLAATEVMANAVRHGGGRGRIRVTHHEGHLLLEISDRGPGIPRRHLGDRPRPRPGRIGMAGLWLVRQICERVDIDTGHGGTTVRLTFALTAHE